jgi:hypothetical protein
MALQNIRQKGAAVAAVAGLGALLVGCGSQTPGVARADAVNAFGVQQQPMAVSCEPNQRAVVRQVAVNGAFQAQVQCETVNPALASVPYGAAVPAPGATPVAYQNGFQQVGYSPAPAGYAPAGYAQPGVPLENAQIVRTAYPQQVVVRDAPRTVSYQPARERVVKPTRSVKKSAIIIGSSAGVGAGVGAAVGGKKGAGIGALIGGGSAAIWDQITRRK